MPNSLVGFRWSIFDRLLSGILFPGSARRQPLTLADMILIISVLAVIMAFVIVVAYKAGFQHTEVVFRNSHEDGRVSETLKGLLPYIISAAIGGAVYAFAERLIRAVWPW